MDTQEIQNVIQRVKGSGRDALLETEGMEILKNLGVRVPLSFFVRSSASISDGACLDLDLLPGNKAVIKVVSHQILHKSDVGGVAIVKKEKDTIRSAIAAMEERFENKYEIAGYTVNEFVPFDSSLGSEFLIGIRYTEDFGPVVTFGAGGIYTEFLSKQFLPGKDICILSADFHASSSEETIGHVLGQVAVAQIATGTMRGQKPRIEMPKIAAVVRNLLNFAREFVPGEISEFEINPFVVSGGELVALDALAKLNLRRRGEDRPARPIWKIKNLLEPSSIALVGVSSDKSSPGRVILGNLIRNGFDSKEIFIVKPGANEIDGCACYPDVASLPKRVDMCVLSISAAQIPTVVTQIIEGRKAESLIVIPGGMEEKSGTEELVGKMHSALHKARESDWKGPVINGGNCVGIQSRPGRYNTVFIPDHKLPFSDQQKWPVAFISQSGAFGISRINKLLSMNPEYMVSIGNQTDLTIGDYLMYLKDDPRISFFAIYVEGFRPLDGTSFLRAAREITKSGRNVLVYRAGRTSAGAKASASHTASIAGDYTVTRELCLQAGVTVVESIEEFEDLFKLFAMLSVKKVNGLRLGTVSNAGFECVAFGDFVGQFTLSSFTPETIQRVQQAFAQARLSQLVDVHNPLDVTPMCGEAAFEQIVRALLTDSNTDVMVVGCVPLSQMITSLPPEPEKHSENIFDERSIAQRLIRVSRESEKPWVAVVDVGPLYDPMAALMEENGIPVFRSADRALRAFNRFCLARYDQRV